MTVTIYELIMRPDGKGGETPAGLGNSRECSLEEAVFLIEEKKATSGTHPIGIVPPTWLEPQPVPKEPVESERLDAE